MFKGLYSFRVYLIFHINPEEEVKWCQIRKPCWPVNRSRLPIQLLPSFLNRYSFTLLAVCAGAPSCWRIGDPGNYWTCCSPYYWSIDLYAALSTEDRRKEIDPIILVLWIAHQTVSFSLLIGTSSTACWFSVPHIQALFCFALPFLWKSHSSEKTILEMYWESRLIALRQCRAQFSLST